MGQALFFGQLFVCHEPFVIQRFDQQVANQAHHQHAHQDVHGLVVNLLAWNAQAELVFTHVVHDHGAQHAGGCPGCEQATVDRAHHLRAENVCQIRGHSGKAAAIHTQNDAERRHKEHDAARRCTAGHAEIHHAAQYEEHDVGELATQFVRQTGPEETSANVEQAQERRKACRHGGDGFELVFVQFTKLGRNADQRATKHFLQHGRGHADHADASTHVHAQHHPDQPELGNAPDLADVHMLLRDHGVADLRGWGRPTFRLPAGFWHAVAKSTRHHEHKVDQGHHDKGLHHAHVGGSGEILHQVCRQG